MKKIIALALALAMCLSVFAFAGAEEAITLKIAHIGPLTGAAAVYGTATSRGAKIAADEINAKGGKYKVEIIDEDDTHDAEKSVYAYGDALDKGAQMIIGTTTTTPCIAVGAEAFNDRVFMLTPSASSTDVTKDKDNVFQVCFTDPAQGAASAEYIAEHKLAVNVAVIYNNADAYSTGIYNTFKDKAKEVGLNIVSTTTFTEDTTDFSVQVADAKNNGAELVFLPIYYTPASQILLNASAIEYKPVFFGVDGMDGILSIEGFDTSLAEGVMLLTPFSADAEDEKTVNFVKSYKDLYGEVPNQFAADAYDGVYALVEAAKVAGVQTGDKAEDVCDAMIAAMQQITYEGVTGTMTWDATGAVSKTPTAVVIENGVYVGFDK
jgi:branched-chain amino acid transport system substrate-binding protein